MSSLDCLSEVTNQSLVGTVKKIVKTCTYNSKKVCYGIALKVSDVSCLFTTPVHGVYGTQYSDCGISNLLQRLHIMGDQMLQCFEVASGCNVVKFGKLFKRTREDITQCVIWVL